MLFPPDEPDGIDKKVPFVSINPQESALSPIQPSNMSEVDGNGNNLRDVPLARSFRRSMDTLSNLSLYSADNDNDRIQQRRTSPCPDPRNLSSFSQIARIRLKDFWISNKGCVLVLIAQAFGSAMGAVTRILETDGVHGKGMHPFQILFVRMVITVACSSLYLLYAKVPDAPWGKRSVRGLLMLRGVGGLCGVVGYYYSLLYLPLGEATVLTFLGPIVACWACSFILHDPFTRSQQIAGLISLLGVILIARPVSLFSAWGSSSDASPSAPAASVPSEGMASTNQTDNNPFTSYAPPPSPGQHVYAILFALVGVIGTACAITAIRWLGNRAHPLLFLNYFSICCTFVSSVAIIFVASVKFRLPGNLTEWTLLLLLGANGFIMQYLLTAGLAYDPVIARAEVGTRLGMVDRDGDVARLDSASKKKNSAGSKATSMLYTNMLFAVILDKVLWGVSPSLISWCGSALIFGSAVWVALKKEESAGSGIDEPDRAKSEEEGRALMEAEGDGEGDREEVELRTMRREVDVE